MKQLPRLHIAHLPTAVEELPRLSAELGGPKLLIKRDDQTGLAFGGNKTRKLEFLVAEAQAHGARMLISTGAVQSNHCRQTAAAAAHFGLDCTLVLALPEDATEKDKIPNGNLLLDRLLNAQIVWTTREERDQILQSVFQEAWDAGKRPYLVPYGGSSPLGASAYVFALEELIEQGRQVDWIVFASSSGGTQAGLVVGGRLFEYSGKILGISVDEPENLLRQRVADLAAEVSELLGEPQTFVAEEILVNDDYLGGGYGVMGEPEREAILLFARKEGILLDPVYTGRAAAGMIDLIRKGFFKADETVLFWHTGGTPALFASRYSSAL